MRKFVCIVTVLLSIVVTVKAQDYEALGKFMKKYSRWVKLFFHLCSKTSDTKGCTKKQEDDKETKRDSICFGSAKCGNFVFDFLHKQESKKIFVLIYSQKRKIRTEVKHK